MNVNTSGLKITAVEQNSLGAQAGLLAGDELVAVNGQPLRDCIDYAYHTSDETLRLRFRRDGTFHEISLEKEPYEDLGLTMEPMGITECGNHCIFCFVEQLPPGLRPSLYVKDEDYRLSFLQGSYITLTGITREELERIRDQRLSPLYVSVHTTDPTLRTNMIRGTDAGNIMDTIEYLIKGNIELHTQVVLCPGINDGPHLDRTIDDLAGLYPQVRSVAVVPVGLTAHRQGLYDLRGVDGDEARTLIKTLRPRQRVFRRTLGETFLHIADEIYLLADVDIPEAEWYDDFPQIENGVGMVRQLLDSLDEQRDRLPSRLDEPLDVTLVTGTSAFPVLERHVRPILDPIENLTLDIVPVINGLLGPSVTVSGLLAGGDIVRTLEKRGGSGIVVLPPNCLNEDGLLLDDATPADMEQRLGRRVVPGEYDIVETLLTLVPSPLHCSMVS